MKKIIFPALLFAFSVAANAQTKSATKKTVPAKPTLKTTTKPATTAPMFKNNLDSACYALGLNVASSFQLGGLKTLNYEMFNKGLKDAFAKANPKLNEQQCRAAITTLFEGFSKQRDAENMKKYQPNIDEGKAFLAQNSTKSGIKVTPSGLQYEVLTPGTGTKPTAEDRVTVNYKGTLLNGKQFDSSYDRGTPATFGLSQVIPGWTEGLQLMQEGAKYRFFIPHQLAYGARETPDGSIPPYSTLIFEVELIKVEK